MVKVLAFQDYDLYDDKDHETWAVLSQRQSRLSGHQISNEYLSGLSVLKLDSSRVVRIDEVSRLLESVSGWTLVPVTGLIPTRDFFYMLVNKKYPINVAIRKPSEIDFSEQPDIFHDVCGHLPLLTNEKFVRFLTTYSAIALKYVNNDRAIELLGRLYWFTYEMGVILEEGKFKAYGGAIITSAEEICNMYNDRLKKYPFDLDVIFSTPYNPYRLQKEYFYIDSFDDLFKSLEFLENTLAEHLLTRHRDSILRNYSLNKFLDGGAHDLITHLNDSQFKFPKAISFMAGQPDEHFFGVEAQLSKFDHFVDEMVKRTGESRDKVVNRIAQYGKTSGLINDILEEHLRKDEQISVKKEDILVTAGAQEAFSIILNTVCDRERDVILTENPSYVGVSCLARLFDYNIEGVDIDEEGIDLKKLREKIIRINRSEKRLKLLYLIPDYQNPSGSCMPVGNRLKVLELAEQYNFLIVEDSVYNGFFYSHDKIPSLKSLDRYNRIIYVGSFSKSLFPGLRIGYIAANQQIERDEDRLSSLCGEMAKVKAQLSNNTSGITQGIVGGVLLAHDYSLRELTSQKLGSYKEKQHCIQEALQRYIGAYKEGWACGISWNKPGGGFFVKLSLSFTVDIEQLNECAAGYNVLFCPMRYFYLDEGGENEIRLAFSNLSFEDIDTGIKRLAAYFKQKLNAADALFAGMERETEKSFLL
jgi:monomeric phenylalanine-4-hydroxylase